MGYQDQSTDTVLTCRSSNQVLTLMNDRTTTLKIYPRNMICHLPRHAYCHGQTMLRDISLAIEATLYEHVLRICKLNFC